MKLLRIVAIAALVCCLSAFGGCATNANNPQTGVFAIQQTYNHALQVGDWYGKLESCGAPVHDPVFCSKPDVVKKIKDAKDVASPAIAAAQATVRNPAFDASTANKVTISAQAALAVLTAITVPLEELLGKAITAGKAQPVGMSASLPRWGGESQTAVIPLLYLLSLLSALLKVLPEGSALWTKYKADKDKIDEIVAEDRVPTDAEWAALNSETAALEASIDANAAAAGG